MTPRWPYMALGAVACAAAAIWPLTPALSPGDAILARVGAGVTAAIASVALVANTGLRRKHLLALAMVSAGACVALLAMHFSATGGCVAEYDGRPVLIGREYLPEAAAYLTGNLGLSPSDRLLDAGGEPARLWTASSIRTCRFWVSWGGLLSIPLLALSIGSLLATSRPGLIRPARTPERGHPPVPAEAAAYDAFLSYRHTEPDRTYATALLESLEGRGFRVAIDVRDFAPNEHFLSEMERCIKQSRYVLCVVTSQYLVSDHTSEEAIISKTVDMAERRKRLVPLIYERVELPVWLHGLVGIDFTSEAAVEPLDRVLALLGPPDKSVRAGLLQ